MWVTDGLSTKCVEKTSVIPEGWRRGRGSDVAKFISHTSENKTKIAEKIKGSVCYNNGIVNLKLKKGEIPPSGFSLGMIQKHDKVWITNGEISKVIKRKDIIPEGWYKGRVIKKKDSNE